MKKILKILLVILTFVVVSCVSGPPELTQNQIERLDNIQMYKEGISQSKKYKKITKISAADCSGAPAGGRVWGDAEKAIQTLKIKAAAQDADAVINISCGSVPFVNNCWAAKKCNGIAVKWTE